MSHQLTNPIIPGYYPDPTIIRVGNDYYLANSSFEMYPGIPLFKSRDLQHWTQIANVMATDNDFYVENSVGVGGVMAPTLRYHKGTYYIMNANFADKGNFIVTATDPAGPWSMPHYLDDIPGIDASIFFDDDDKCYVCGTGNVWDNGAGVMERGIWAAEYDIENFKLIGEPVCIFNNALRVSTAPEAPHIYHIGDYYYLIIAEGGTEFFHSVVVARSKDVLGFYEGYKANPIMTHRHLGKYAKLQNMGHADLVDTPDGRWYAVMLGSRLINGESKNLGRETFIVPVDWEDGWPLMSRETGKVEWSYDLPEDAPWDEEAEHAKKTATTYTFEDSCRTLPLEFVTLGTPKGKFYEIKDNRLELKCIPWILDRDLAPIAMTGTRKDDHYTSLLGVRQCQPKTGITAKMNFMPEGKEEAGLVIVQALDHQIHFVRTAENGKQLLRLNCTTADYNVPPFIPGFEGKTNHETLAEVEYSRENIVLKMELDGNNWHFCYGEDEEHLELLAEFDGAIINPEKVGCMTGTILAMYATANFEESEHSAKFDYFKVEE